MFRLKNPLFKNEFLENCQPRDVSCQFSLKVLLHVPCRQRSVSFLLKASVSRECCNSLLQFATQIWLKKILQVPVEL